MTAAPLTLADQIVASCVGLLLIPEVASDPDWSQLLVAEMHDRLPDCSTTHPQMAPLLREIPRAWLRGGAPPTPNGLYRCRRAWVDLTKWRLGLAVAAAPIERTGA